MSGNKTFKNYRDISRVNYGLQFEDGESPTKEDLTTGCLLRIADSIEAMAKNYVQLQSDFDWYKSQYREQRNEIERMTKRINSLKGWVTRLKKALLKEKVAGV